MQIIKYTFLLFMIWMCLLSIARANEQNDDPVFCLASNIYHEARGEPLLGQYMVGFVTMNRVESDLYPDTICEVVKQPKQFSWYNKRKNIVPRNPHTNKAWKRSVKIALQFIYDPDSVAKDPTEGALWYHANYVKPKWRHMFVKVDTVGSHIFYKN